MAISGDMNARPPVDVILKFHALAGIFFFRHFGTDPLKDWDEILKVLSVGCWVAGGGMRARRHEKIVVAPTYIFQNGSIRSGADPVQYHLCHKQKGVSEPLRCLLPSTVPDNLTSSMDTIFPRTKIRAQFTDIARTFPRGLTGTFQLNLAFPHKAVTSRACLIAPI